MITKLEVRKGLKIYFHGWVGGWAGGGGLVAQPMSRGWVAGSIETKAISASNLKLKLKLTVAELGKNNSNQTNFPFYFFY